MRKTIAALLFTALALSACVGEEPPEPGARVVRSGWSVRDGVLGVAAVLRGVDGEATGPITIETTIRDGGTTETRESELPYCPENIDCWWGESYTDVRETSGVDVAIKSVGEVVARLGPLTSLDIGGDATDPTVVTPGAEGTVYLVALDNGAPRFGSFSYVDERTPRQLKPGFPARDGETVKAYFYPGPVPAGVRGPAD